MEVNLAQRMQMLGYQPELMEEGERDIRFAYRKQEQAPPGGGAMMPPGGAMMPPGGGMPMRSSMPRGGGMPMPPIPPSQPGGEGMGMRTPRSPARPQQRGSPGAGSPVTSVQQRGPAPSIQETNTNALQNARRPRGA